MGCQHKNRLPVSPGAGHGVCLDCSSRITRGADGQWTDRPALRYKAPPSWRKRIHAESGECARSERRPRPLNDLGASPLQNQPYWREWDSVDLIERGFTIFAVAPDMTPTGGFEE